MRSATGELRGRGLIVERADDGTVARRELTPAGCDVLGRLIAARRARLTELFAEWAPEKREELARVLRGIAQELIPEVRQGKT